MACCVSAIAGGQRVRARQERPRDRGQGRLEAGHEGGAVEGSRWSDPACQRRPRHGPPELTGRRGHEGVLGQAGGRWPVAGGRRGRCSEQAQQRRLGRLEGALDGARVEGVRLGQDGLEVDAAARVAAVARTPGAGRALGTAQGLEQRALLDARAARQQLHVAVAADGVRDGAQRGQHGSHEPLAAGDGALVVAGRGAVDEELHDGLRVLGGRAPGVRARRG